LSSERYHVFWTHDTVRCVLIPTGSPQAYAVQVLDDSRAFVTEPCADPEEGAHIAERLSQLFLKKPV